MDRREYLSLLGGGTAITVAGCSSEDNGNGDNPSTTTTEETDTPAVPSVSVTSEGLQIDDSVHTITVRYATNTLPPNSSTLSPGTGQKFLVLHGEVTVESESDSTLDFYAVWGIEADGVIYEGRVIPNLPTFTKTVNPPATFEGWLAYEIPEDVTEATLTTVDADLYYDLTPSVLFEPDDSLSATIPQD